MFKSILFLAIAVFASLPSQGATGAPTKVCGKVYLNQDGSKGIVDPSGNHIRLLQNSDLNQLGEFQLLSDYETAIYTLLYVGKDICAIGLENRDETTLGTNETGLSNWNLYNPAPLKR